MTLQYSRFMRWTSRVVILSMLTMGLPMQAFADMIDTGQAVSHELANQDRAKINAFLDRQDVVAQLQKQGVTANEAKARVYALTDGEAHNIAGKLNQLPAGGDGVLGVLLTVFVILLITDILGFTKVFPFTHSINSR
ncbi:MAG TPA: PA2779 family protein [Gallionella sp.]|nr:PA2779 family protein [Gallionella sp.]